MENISYVFNLSSTFVQRECLSPQGATLQSLECMNKYFCPQLSNHLVRIGIILIISTILVFILSDQFVKRLYKYVDWSNAPKFVGDMESKENRLQWKIVAIDIINSIMMFYIWLVVYLNL